jgi:sterol desaturase/sphingolipid hydroxylase (fatty acid hydroxylase superfamily)
MLWLLAYFGTGLLVHLAEKRWPLRTYQKPKALAVDALGASIAVVVAYALRHIYPYTIDRLPDVPGFAWIPMTSQFVQANVSWPVAFLGSVLLLDFLSYFAHRLLHTSYLWHTHAAHHSVEHLYWFGGARVSPVHCVVQGTCGAFLGLVWPVNGGMAGLVAGALLYVCMQHFNHANLRLRLGALEWLFVVPRYHFVHHGADKKLNNSNFGFLLTVWDRIFGTYTNPDDASDNFPLGLNYEIGFGRLFVGLPPRALAQSTSEAGAPDQVSSLTASSKI